MSHPLLNDIVRKLDYITETIEAIKIGQQPYLALEDAACYLRIAKSTLYKHTSEGLISFYKPNGKVILFSKDDLEKFIRSKRVNSNQELLNQKM